MSEEGKCGVAAHFVWSFRIVKGEAPPAALEPNDLCYAIFTSGSTGAVWLLRGGGKGMGGLRSLGSQKAVRKELSLLLCFAPLVFHSSLGQECFEHQVLLRKD